MRQKSKLSPTVIISSELAELSEVSAAFFQKQLFGLIDLIKDIKFVVSTKLPQLIAEELIGLENQNRVFGNINEFLSTLSMSLNAALVAMSTDKYTRYADSIGIVCHYHNKIESQVKKINASRVSHTLSLNSMLRQAQLHHRFPLVIYGVLFGSISLMTVGALDYKHKLIVASQNNATDKPFYTVIYPDILLVDAINKDTINKVRRQLVTGISKNSNNPLGKLYHQIYLSNNNSEFASFVKGHITLIAEILSVNRDKLLIYVESSPLTHYQSYHFSQERDMIDINIIDRVLADPKITVQEFKNSQHKIRLYLADKLSQCIDTIKTSKSEAIIDNKSIKSLSAIMKIKIHEPNKKIDFFNLIEKS
ncbi:hypothetical protein [Piscirickettsia litoralis]|uniref:Uncharacterized protein n=1 Tax=Piscirickettsia litoralis TaxID=1891921 RepID=A0ABX3A4H2_9GAMM|nr:hypothetical protein [Piscirickettsia litoralis]ODN42561.1 hypothetical protein BGC07_05985 [Piscirickettsia litoralis]